MTTITAAELARHLRDLVDDEDFIQRTVQKYKKEVRQAAEYRRAITKEEQARSIRSSPDTFAHVEARDKLAVARGADVLLRAIHREHPQIMKRLYHLGNARRALGQHGPVVVYP